MFEGRFERTIDAKGRVSLPSRFREILSSRYADDRLIVTSMVDPCLIAYPVVEWQILEERVRQLQQSALEKLREALRSDPVLQ